MAMTADMTLAAVIEAIGEEKGAEASSWAALADLLTEQGGEEKAAAAARWLAVAADAAPTHRLSYPLSQLFAKLSLRPVEACRFAWRIAASFGCKISTDSPALPDAASFRRFFDSVPYVGHENVNPRMRRTADGWRGDAATAGLTSKGGPVCPSDVVSLVTHLRYAAVATAEIAAS